MKKILGFFLLFLSTILLLSAIFLSTRASKENPTFSTYTFLNSAWEKYKAQFINKDGRVIDYSQNDITTSEGQSYALLRAVWVGDKETFDLVWNWTKNNLQKKDKLFGWKWGKTANGYGFNSSSDRNSAADADSDIALALILAARRWDDSEYLDSAKEILNGIWSYEVVSANGYNYLIAGNWANTNGNLIINPSYFSPFAYRIFAEVNPARDWNSLVNSSYKLLNDSSNYPIDKGKSVGLPPDWVSINSITGEITKPDLKELTTNYSYEALRIPWRIALDLEWNDNNQAKKYLQNNFKFLFNEYKNKNKLASVYSHDGSIIEPSENPSSYATALSAFSIIDNNIADKLYREKIINLYSNDTNSFNNKLPYYEQNWLWFGSALHLKQLQKFE